MATHTPGYGLLVYFQDLANYWIIVFIHSDLNQHQQDFSGSDIPQGNLGQRKSLQNFLEITYTTYFTLSYPVLSQTLYSYLSTCSLLYQWVNMTKFKII